MKILIVEDEIKTGEYLSKGLTEAGFVVDYADTPIPEAHLPRLFDRFYRVDPSSNVKAKAAGSGLPSSNPLWLPIMEKCVWNLTLAQRGLSCLCQRR